MPHSFQVQPSGKLVLVVFEGEISPEEERQALVDFASHPGVDLASDILVDRSKATMTVRAQDVKPQIELARSTFPAGERQPRMAIVAPADVDFGMARMMELSGGDDLPHKVMVCRNLEDACAWLGVEPGDVVRP